MPRVPNEKIKKLYSQHVTLSEKGDATCHINKDAQSVCLMGYSKTKFFYKDEI